MAIPVKVIAIEVSGLVLDVSALVECQSDNEDIIKVGLWERRAPKPFQVILEDGIPLCPAVDQQLPPPLCHPKQHPSSVPCVWVSPRRLRFPLLVQKTTLSRPSDCPGRVIE